MALDPSLVSGLQTAQKGIVLVIRDLQKRPDYSKQPDFKTYVTRFNAYNQALLNALAPICVLVGGGYLVIQGETSVGIIVAFISGFDRMSSPMRELLSYYRVASQAAVQHRLIAKWMS